MNQHAPRAVPPLMPRPNPIIDALSDALGALRADDDMQELAKALEELDPAPIEQLSVDQARAQPTVADAVERLLRKQDRWAPPGQLVPGVTRASRTLETPAGDLHAFVYTPQDNLRDHPFPLILYFHGGGWVIASAEVYDASARALAHDVRAVVVSVDYRLAPEHRFPAAWDDAIASYRWALEHARALGADPTRIALAGESAGGNLAISTAVTARDAALPSPRHVLAVYPVAQTGSRSTESYLENAIAKPLNRAMMKWFMDHTFASDADRADPRVDLVNADLHGLPPMTILNASLDPLRSDGAMLADALNAAGGRFQRETYRGVAHEFYGCAAVLEKAKDAQAFAAMRLRVALA